MVCNPHGQGCKLTARATRFVFLPRENCKRVRGLAAERDRDATDRRVIWNSIPPDPVNNSGNTEPCSKKTEQMGPRRNHSKGRFDAFRFLLLSLRGNGAGRADRSVREKATNVHFRNGLKAKSCTAETLRWKNF